MLLIVYNQIHIQCFVSALHLYASNSLTFHEIFSHQESCDCMLLNPYQECTIEAEFIVKRGDNPDKGILPVDCKMDRPICPLSEKEILKTL